MPWNCVGSGLSLSVTQPGGPGASIRVVNSNLTPGRRYLNLFSLDPCPSGPGSGPGAFGACITTAANIQFVTSQITSPVGTAPFHVVAPGSYALWGPFTVPPLTLDAICLDVTDGSVSAASSVVRIVVQ